MARAQGEFYERLGERLREARDRAGMTQEAIARAIGLSRTSIANIENGRQPVMVHVLVRLAATLSLDAAALIPREDDVPQSGVPSVMKNKTREVQAWAAKIDPTLAAKGKSGGS